MNSRVSFLLLISCPGGVWADVTPRRLDGHKKEVLAVAFCSDGKLLASGGKDNRIILWDPETAKQTASWTAHARPVIWLAFSPDGKALASGDEEGEVSIWDPATQEKRHTLANKARFVRFAFSPDSKTLAVTQFNPPLRFVDVETGNVMGDAPIGGVGVAYSADGTHLLVGQERARGMRLIELGKERGKFGGIKKSFEGNVDAVAFHPDGKIVAGGFFQRDVGLFDLASGKKVATFLTPGNCVAVTFSRDGNTLAASARMDASYSPAAGRIGLLSGMSRR